MATFAAIVGSDIVFPKSFRGVGGGSYQTNNIDSLFTPRGFIAPCWTGATVMGDYINGRCVPKRSACSGEYSGTCH
jgi:ketol-acid reductoisomerase